VNKFFPYTEMDHQKILLYGFHFSFLFIFLLAVLRDIYFQHYFNASINFTAWMSTGISYYLLHYKKYTILTSYIIIAIATIPLYILIYFNHFGNMVIVYVLLIPIAVFFLLPFKNALHVNTLLYLLLIGMLYYISNINPNAPILNNKQALINIGFVSILTIFFGIFYHLAIESTLKKLIASNHQKDILLKEVHHRVKNNLNLTASMLGLQALHIPEEIKIHIIKSKTRIESIAAVHEMLYVQESLDKIIFYDYIIKLERLLSKTYSGKEKYQLHIEVDKHLTFSLNTMVQFGLMLNEMLVNTLKYAKAENTLIITISLSTEIDGYLFIYKDNGLNPKSVTEIQNSSGLGSKLIQLCAKQINGTMDIFYSHGLIYQLRIHNA